MSEDKGDAGMEKEPTTDGSGIIVYVVNDLGPAREYLQSIGIDNPPAMTLLRAIEVSKETYNDVALILETSTVRRALNQYGRNVILVKSATALHPGIVQLSIDRIPRVPTLCASKAHNPYVSPRMGDFANTYLYLEELHKRLAAEFGRLGRANH